MVLILGSVDAANRTGYASLPPYDRTSRTTRQAYGAIGFQHWVRTTSSSTGRNWPSLLTLALNSVAKADSIQTWLERQLPDRPHPKLVRPINYVKIAVTTTSILGVITFLTVAAPYVWPVISNRNLWAAVSLIAVLLFTSGHMFNHIRHAPYVGGDGKGGVSYFAGGFQNQFGLETQIVAAMCKSWTA